MRAGQSNESITEILTLKQNEYHKNDYDAGRSERMKQRGDQALQALEGARFGRAYFHRNGCERCRSLGTKDCARAKRGRSVLRFIQFLAQVLQHAGRAFKGPASGCSVAK